MISVGVEAGTREDLAVGPEEDAGAAPARGAHLLERSRRLAADERLLPLRAVALHARHQLLAERVHHRRPDAVQAAGVVVALGLELAAGVQRGEDELQRRLLVLCVAVDRDATAVVGDGGRCAVLVEHDRDAIGVAVHGLVDRVVDDLPHEVVQSRRRRRRRCTCPAGAAPARGPREPGCPSRCSSPPSPTPPPAGSRPRRRASPPSVLCRRACPPARPRARACARRRRA